MTYNKETGEVVKETKDLCFDHGLKLSDKMRPVSNETKGGHCEVKHCHKKAWRAYEKKGSN